MSSSGGSAGSLADCVSARVWRGVPAGVAAGILAWGGGVCIDCPQVVQTVGLDHLAESLIAALQVDVCSAEFADCAAERTLVWIG